MNLFDKYLNTSTLNLNKEVIVLNKKLKKHKTLVNYLITTIVILGMALLTLFFFKSNTIALISILVTLVVTVIITHVVLYIKNQLERTLHFVSMTLFQRTI